MLSFQNHSIRRKQMLILMLTSTVSLLLACASFVAYDVSRFGREMVASLSSLAEVVGKNTTAAIDFNDPRNAEQTLAALQGEPNIVLAHVHMPDGELFASYVRSGAPPVPDVPHSIETRHLFTATHLHLFRPISQGGEQIATIELVAELNQLRDRLWRYAGIAGLVLILSLLAAFGLSNRLQQLISNPILHLAEVARSVAIEKDYSVRATKQSNDELGQLVDGLNEMLYQIQQRDVALQSAHTELEARVFERTTQLAEANAALQTENTERKLAQARQRAEEARYLRQRNALISFTGEGPSDSEDLVGAIRRLTETSAATLGIARVSAWRYHHDRGALHCLDLYEVEPDRHSSDFELTAADYPAYFRALATREVITADDAFLHPSTCEFSENHLRPLGISSMLDAPIQMGGATEGVLCCEHVGPPRRWTTDEETFVVAMANVAALALEESQRKQAQAELEIIHKQLLEASRLGGMAEIATNVLHNVGNALNSVNVSAGLVVETVRKSRASSLGRVVALLQDHEHDLGEFITRDPKGRHVTVLLAHLSEHLLADQAAIVTELDSLRQNVEHIKQIVAMQQSYARIGGVKEMVDLIQLVEDSLRMNEGALSRHEVEVIREFQTVPPMNVEKHKILQILVNLLRNAKHACQDTVRSDKRLTVQVVNGAGRVRISVIDNGIGISSENLTRIFNYGFTTRKGGHGFGLHSGALAAMELGGSLTAHSDGPGHGAVFTLELPLPVEEEHS
jgi:signal transduction histidine kinase/HAMP domain-containing protein